MARVDDDRLYRRVTSTLRPGKAFLDPFSLFPLFLYSSDGNYSFVAWTGIDDKFTTSEFSRGVTTKKDVLLRIRS